MYYVNVHSMREKFVKRKFCSHFDNLNSIAYFNFQIHNLFNFIIN